jgi:predicted choloylglycine hydrolase
VYAISIRLKLESLARKAFHFLQATTNIQNITARVFGEFAAEHPEVERWYEEYFLARWDEVKGLKEHNDFMQPSGGNDCRVFQNFWRLLSSRK